MCPWGGRRGQSGAGFRAGAGGGRGGDRTRTPPPPREALDVVFMGTPAFAATILEALIEAGHHIRAVYTQPPRPAGRGHRPQPSPVQLLAIQHRLPVNCPVSLRPPATQPTLPPFAPPPPSPAPPPSSLPAPL